MLSFGERMKLLMRKSIMSVLIGAVVFGLGLTVLPAQDKQQRERLNERIDEVNKVGRKAGMQLAIQRVSTETGVPLEQIQAIHKRHPNVGPAGILIACVLADETKKPAEDFARAASGGKGWAAQAREHKVPLEKLDARLDRLERALTKEQSTENNRREKK